MTVSPVSLILVAVMNDPRDLEIARLLGWYRIPLRSAPKVISVDYLAFYQTGAFGEEKWCIQYLAPLRGHELTTRAELLQEEPDHPYAKHEYYKLQLGPLERLPRPIPANKWRRITFFYTLGELLLNAQTIDDLVIQAGERQTLWRALRERSDQSSRLAQNDLPEVDLEPDILAMLLGIKEASGEYGYPFSEESPEDLD